MSEPVTMPSIRRGSRKLKLESSATRPFVRDTSTIFTGRYQLITRHHITPGTGPACVGRCRPASQPFMSPRRLPYNSRRLVARRPSGRSGRRAQSSRSGQSELQCEHSHQSMATPPLPSSSPCTLDLHPPRIHPATILESVQRAGGSFLETPEVKGCVLMATNHKVADGKV